MLRYHPTVSSLQSLIAKVPDYPVSADELVELATQGQVDRATIEFYRAFPGNELFENEEDLIARSEQIEIMNREDQPFEYWASPEED